LAQLAFRFIQPALTLPPALLTSVSRLLELPQTPICKQMKVDPNSLQAALIRLASGKAEACRGQGIKVLAVTRHTDPKGFFVTTTADCAAVLAHDLARLTGRLLVPDDSSWVLLEHEAELIIHYLGGAEPDH
jgi:hypothetical protein